MSELVTEQSTHTVVPRVVVAEGVADEQVLPAEWLGQVMQERKISAALIQDTTYYMDASSHYSFRGSMWPRGLGRLRFGSIDPALSSAPGPIVRLSTVMKGERVSRAAIERTVRHEIEHVAQLEHDRASLAAGWTAIVGLSAAGGLAGDRLTLHCSGETMLVATLAGAAVGNYLGYSVAAHERKARSAVR